MSVPVVEIENLVKRYQELVALDHFNLTIEEGEIFGLLGPNGSGKTTTINCILALLAFDKGTVRVFGREMRPDSYDLKRQIGTRFFSSRNFWFSAYRLEWFLDMMRTSAQTIRTSARV